MFFKKKKRKIINVDGMTCEHCAKKIEQALENLVDITSAKVNLKKKEVIVNYDTTVDDILLQTTIESLGYIVTGMKESS